MLRQIKSLKNNFVRCGSVFLFSSFLFGLHAAYA